MHVAGISTVLGSGHHHFDMYATGIRRTDVPRPVRADQWAAAYGLARGGAKAAGERARARESRQTWTARRGATLNPAASRTSTHAAWEVCVGNPNRLQFNIEP